MIGDPEGLVNDILDYIQQEVQEAQNDDPKQIDAM